MKSKVSVLAELSTCPINGEQPRRDRRRKSALMSVLGKLMSAQGAIKGGIGAMKVTAKS